MAVELSSTGEREENLPLIISSARKILGRPDIKVFVPAFSQKRMIDDSCTMFYMDGYAFVEFRPDIQYLKLRDTTFFRDVLCQPGPKGGYGPKYSLIENKDLNPLRVGMQELKTRGFSIGDPVIVVRGFHKNLLGKVSMIHEGSEKVQIHIAHLSSKPLMMDFPVTFLERVKS